MVLLDCLSFFLFCYSVEFCLRFCTFSETSDFFSKLVVLVEVCSEGGSQVGQITLIFFSNFSQSNNCCILLVNKLTQSCFSFNKTIWDIKFSTESWEPNNKFNWINVAGNDNKLSLLFFNKFCNMVKTEFEMIWSWFLNSFFWIKIFLLSALSLASWTRRAFFCFVSSGEYFLSNLKRTLVWFLSRALENWAISGGTLILVKRILFCLWKVMYLGHLTNLVKFLLGWILLPTLKFLGLLWNKGFDFFSVFFTALFLA